MKPEQVTVYVVVHSDGECLGVFAKEECARQYLKYEWKEKGAVNRRHAVKLDPARVLLVDTIHPYPFQLEEDYEPPPDPLNTALAKLTPDEMEALRKHWGGS